MNHVAIGTLVLLGSVSAISVDAPNRLLDALEETLMAAQQALTAGDMHSMSVMLSAQYIMDHRLPSEAEFDAWLNTTFKENGVKDLALDHWGRPYRYSLGPDRRSYLLVSLGPDGAPGTADDMSIHGP